MNGAIIFTNKILFFQISCLQSSMVYLAELALTLRNNRGLQFDFLQSLDFGKRNLQLEHKRRIIMESSPMSLKGRDKLQLMPYFDLIVDEIPRDQVRLF